MSERIEPADAARALGEIDRRREQVIRRRVIPAWFWWVNALLIVALAASAESGRGVLVWVGIAVFVAVSLAITVPVSRAGRAAPVYHGGSRPPGYTRRVLIGVAGFLAVLVGLTVAIGLSLKAIGVPYPATIAATVAAVAFALGGQMLVRYEADVLVRRSGTGSKR
jgi:hypothetical protein